MEILNVIEVASVKLMEIEISEDELDVYESCLKYVLQNCSPREIEDICGATKDELDGMQYNLTAILQKYTDINNDWKKSLCISILKFDEIIYLLNESLLTVIQYTL